MFKIKAIVETIEFLPFWVVVGGRCINLRHRRHGREAGMAAADPERTTTLETGSSYQPTADVREPDLDFRICA
jgi:hypothetical protein